MIRNPNSTDPVERGVGMFSAMVIGVAVGAVSLFMANKKNREKVFNFLNNLQDQGEKKVMNAKDKIDEIREDVQGRIESASSHASRSGNGRSKR